MTGEATENSGGDRAHQMAKSSRRLSALTMLSRLLGLAREQIFALTLGAGATSDAFLAAFRIPNLLRDLFAEGALAKAFIPTYVETLAARVARGRVRAGQPRVVDADVLSGRAGAGHDVVSRSRSSGWWPRASRRRRRSCARRWSAS